MPKPNCEDCRKLELALRDLVRGARPVVEERVRLRQADRAGLTSAWHDAKMVLMRRGVRV